MTSGMRSGKMIFDETCDPYDPGRIVFCPMCGKRMKLSADVYLWICPDYSKQAKSKNKIKVQKHK